MVEKMESVELDKIYTELSDRNEKLFWKVWNRFSEDERGIITDSYTVLDILEARIKYPDGLRNDLGDACWGLCEWIALTGVCQIRLDIENLPDDVAEYVIAHELAHALLHGDDEQRDRDTQEKEDEANFIAEVILHGWGGLL